VRTQIDNLYTLYVDLLAARETLNFERASLTNFDQILSVKRSLKEKGVISAAEVDRLQAQRDAAEIAVFQSEGAVRNAQRALAVLLNVPVAQAQTLELRAKVRVDAPPPPQADALVSRALELRPDLVAQRLGVLRAEADVTLARRNRYQDVYMLYQPFTFQNNAPFDRKSGYGWAVGMTVPLPVYNRNQGNIERARLNVTQTKVELTALEQQAVGEVVRAAQDYDVTRTAVERMRDRILPASQRAVDSTKQLYETGEAANVVVYLTAIKDHNDMLRQYLDMLVRHRRSMLRLNTVVGQRILP
jgi:cobalt-zinc-cadmium efflux system outer membrane protein